MRAEPNEQKFDAERPSMTHQQAEVSENDDGEPTQSSLICRATLLPPLLTVGAGGSGDKGIGHSNMTSTTTLSYRDPSPAWQVSFSIDGAWFVVAVGSPSACIRVYHNRYVHERNRQERGQQENDSPDGGDAEWTLHATLRNSDMKKCRTIRSVAVAPSRSPGGDSPSVVLAGASFDGSIAIWEYMAYGNGNGGGGSSSSSGNNPVPSNHNSASRPPGWHCVAQLEGHESEVKCVCWNATGALLASCGRDKTVWIWEHLGATIGGKQSDWECLAVLPGHDADVKCVRFAASHDQWGDGDEILLSGSYDDTVKVWAEDVGEWYCAATIADVHSSTIWSIAVAPSSTRLVSGSADGSLAIYKCFSQAEYRRLFPGDAGLAVSNSNAVWKCVGKLSGAHFEPAYCVAYAPARCGHGRIASGGGDGRIHVYREVLQSSPDQPKFVLDASAITDHGDVNHVCWHPWDGSTLASVGDDGAVRLWNYTSR